MRRWPAIVAVLLGGAAIGAVAIVVLTACFPQDRAAFLVGLALWGAACALVATLLRNFAAYAAALAGYTAAIIASDQLGATGGPNGRAFTLGVYHVSEIWIGIVCAGIILAGTTAPRRLAAQFAALSAEIASRFNTTPLCGSVFSDLQRIPRELTRQVIVLDPVHRLASLAETRARILAICDTLTAHGDYFDTGASR